MTIKNGVVWTRAGGEPQKLAAITVLNDRVVFDIPESAHSAPPLSLIWPWADIGTLTEYKRTANLPLPPFMMSHVPPPHRSSGVPNLQRRLLETIIAQFEDAPPPGFDTDWEMLMLGGRDGIGHMDFFRHDDEAKAWYAQLAATPTWHSGRSGLWHGIHHQILSALPENEQDIELSTLVGPTPSVGGMIPKLLLAIPPLAPEESWDGSYVSSATLSEQAKAHHVVAKIETRNYPGLVALEALCLEIHKEAGLLTPHHWTLETEEGLRILAIERFGRQTGRPLLLESAFSILHLAQNTVSQTHGDLDMLGLAIRAAKLGISHHPSKDAEDAYARLLLALLTGNGDLHWDNWSFLQCKGHVGLSPVYDPAPMRAYAQHSMLMVMPFAGLARNTVSKRMVPANIGSRLLQMAVRAFGIPEGKARRLMSRMLAVTADYPDRIQQLVAANLVPVDTSQNLISTQETVRRFIQQAL